jgi:hypothetical protein
MIELIRKLVVLTGILLGLPFWAYGVVGVIRHFHIDYLLSRYLSLSISSNLLKSIILIAIGTLVAFAIKVLADRLR